MNTISSFFLILPEFFLSFLIITIILVNSFLRNNKNKILLFLTIIILILLISISGFYLYFGFYGNIFNGLYILDPISYFIKIVSYLNLLIILIYGNLHVNFLNLICKNEIYSLSLFALLGQIIVTSANNLIIIYLGIELMSLSLYSLIAMRKDSILSIEASIKYFILSSLSSGIFLYGLSMIYGATSCLDLINIKYIIIQGKSDYTILVFGLLFAVCGLLFKFGSVPFHMWIPDVYHGSDLIVTLILSSAPKLSVFIVTMRLFIESISDISDELKFILVISSISSIFIGNVTAIAQVNLKRMIAYSSISHVGFVILCISLGMIQIDVNNKIQAYGSALFYIVIYIFNILGSIGTILILSKNSSEFEQISNLSGLYKNYPHQALILLIMMFSSSGIPPTAGFHSKLLVLHTAIISKNIFLAFIISIMSVIGLYYYLRIIKIMYFEKTIKKHNKKNNCFQKIQVFILYINATILFILGIFPNILLNNCMNIVRNSFIFFD